MTLSKWSSTDDTRNKEVKRLKTYTFLPDMASTFSSRKSLLVFDVNVSEETSLTNVFGILTIEFPSNHSFYF